MKAPWLEPQGGQEASAVAKTKPLPDEVDAASNPPPVVEKAPRTAPVAESGAPPETTVASAGRSGPPPERLRSVLETIALVIAPASLISALAFYFGWVFTGSRARYFGLDPSVLDLSGQDYILRSTDALFVPLVALLLTVLVALGLHAIVHGWIEAKRRLDLLRWGARGLLALGTVLLALGLWSMREPLPFPTPFLFAQLSSGLGVAFLGYAVYLGGRLNEVDGGRTYPRPRWLSLAGLVLVVLIIALSLFWAASVYATALGHGGAMDIAANLDGRPAAVVYSKEHLHLAGPGVETGMLPGRHSAYRFRYSGLRLLLRSGGRLFLVPAQWSPSHGSVIVLPESPTIRVEFMTAPASSAAR